ncbi:unnamed protein product [marine sediment metagenome]|uniref:Uncharacterized protein n=1 Tax=marine sediment metagenome TaxID=412755 RepID=X1TMU4_9ZZZZ
MKQDYQGYLEKSTYDQNPQELKAMDRELIQKKDISQGKEKHS